MKSYEWWLGQSSRVKKKYTLFLGEYLSPRELRLWHKEWDKLFEKEAEIMLAQKKSERK